MLILDKFEPNSEASVRLLNSKNNYFSWGDTLDSDGYNRINSHYITDEERNFLYRNGFVFVNDQWSDHNYLVKQIPYPFNQINICMDKEDYRLKADAFIINQTINSYRNSIHVGKSIITVYGNTIEEAYKKLLKKIKPIYKEYQEQTMNYLKVM